MTHAKLIGVLGNNDGENVHLLKNFLEVNGDLKGELGKIEVDGLKVGIYHGTSKELKEWLTNSGEFISLFVDILTQKNHH